MEEVWKDIPDYEGLYKISNSGKIRSCDRVVPHSKGFGARIIRGRILILKAGTKGYLSTALSKNGTTNTVRVHRVVASVFIPNPFGLPEINHIDENKLNNSVTNLEWISHIDNIRYGTGIKRSAMSRVGKSNHFGEKTGTSKLKESQVIEIYNSSDTYLSICKKYGIGVACVSRIKNKKSWKHILTNK